MKKKELRRSDNNKLLAGICGGIGEYYDVDPVLIRAATIVVTVLTGILPGVLAYLLLILVIPPPSDRTIVEGEVVDHKK